MIKIAIDSDSLNANYLILMAGFISKWVIMKKLWNF
jgi:hypothetical protein